MIPYKYLTTGQCIEQYPVIYHDAQQTDKEYRYLVLHEVRDRGKNNWQEGDQWNQYRGIVTWNPCLYAAYRYSYNIVYCPQFMNIKVHSMVPLVPFEDRESDVCSFYGPPVSQGELVMSARYDVPLSLKEMGMRVDAYGVMPEKKRSEYRESWKSIFRGSVPEEKRSSVTSLHKFNICFENSVDPYYACGWVTEKIFYSLGSGCIPIYWGAPDIEEHVPKEVFIDYRNFDTIKDLYAYLIKTPVKTFSKMAEEGVEFFNTIDFGQYLEVFEELRKDIQQFKIDSYTKWWGSEPADNEELQRRILTVELFNVIKEEISQLMIPNQRQEAAGQLVTTLRTMTLSDFPSLPAEKRAHYEAVARDVLESVGE